MGQTIIPFPNTTTTQQPRFPVAQASCEHRKVTADGCVVCKKVPKGNAAVSPSLCATCPAATVGCQHLRFTLRQHESVPITVRYAGGRTEVWDDVPPSMRFTQAACVLRREAVTSPADCAGCTLRLAVPDADITGRQRDVATVEPRRVVATG